MVQKCNQSHQEPIVYFNIDDLKLTGACKPEKSPRHESFPVVICHKAVLVVHWYNKIRWKLSFEHVKQNFNSNSSFYIAQDVVNKPL